MKRMSALVSGIALVVGLAACSNQAVEDPEPAQAEGVEASATDDEAAGWTRDAKARAEEAWESGDGSALGMIRQRSGYEAFEEADIASTLDDACDGISELGLDGLLSELIGQADSYSDALDSAFFVVAAERSQCPTESDPLAWMPEWSEPLWTVSECEAILAAFKDSEVGLLLAMRTAGIDVDSWWESTQDDRVTAIDEFLKANRLIEAVHDEGQSTVEYLDDINGLVAGSVHSSIPEWAFEIYNVNRESRLVGIPTITDVGVSAVALLPSPASRQATLAALTDFTCD